MLRRLIKNSSNASFFVIRIKMRPSVEERDLSNEIMNRLTNRVTKVTKLKQQKTTVQLKFLIKTLSKKKNGLFGIHLFSRVYINSLYRGTFYVWAPGLIVLVITRISLYRGSVPCI